MKEKCEDYTESLKKFSEKYLDQMNVIKCESEYAFQDRDEVYLLDDGEIGPLNCIRRYNTHVYMIGYAVGNSNGRSVSVAIFPVHKVRLM